MKFNRCDWLDIQQVLKVNQRRIKNKIIILKKIKYKIFRKR